MSEPEGNGTMTSTTKNASSPTIEVGEPAPNTGTCTSSISYNLLRFKLIVEYDGTRFKGFQRQSPPPSEEGDVILSQSTNAAATAAAATVNNKKQKQKQEYQQQRRHKRRHFETSTGHVQQVPLTIQEFLEDAILDYCNTTSSNNSTSSSSSSKTLIIPRSVLQFKFASRTDGGVHARGQVVAVNLPQNFYSKTNPESTGGGGGGGGKDGNNREDTPPNPSDNNNQEEEHHHHHQEEQMLHLLNIRKSINSRLPTDISISHVSLCHNNSFDPRQGVQRKQYSYTIKYRRKRILQHPNPLMSCGVGGPHTIRNALDPPTVWICPWSLDDSHFDKWCSQLSGTHDYTAFCHKAVRRQQQDPTTTVKDNVLTVTRFSCERQEQPLHQVSSSFVAIDEAASSRNINIDLAATEQPVVVTARFVIEAQGFRRSMIRNLIGFVADLARGAIEDNTIQNLLNEEGAIWTGTEDVATLVHQAPACGLCLEHVWYEKINNP